MKLLWRPFSLYVIHDLFNISKLPSIKLFDFFFLFHHGIAHIKSFSCSSTDWNCPSTWVWLWKDYDCLDLLFVVHYCNFISSRRCSELKTLWKIVHCVWCSGWSPRICVVTLLLDPFFKFELLWSTIIWSIICSHTNIPTLFLFHIFLNWQ